MHTLNLACEAVACEVEAWLRNAPRQLQDPVPDERIELFVLQLGSLFTGTIRLAKTRVLEKVRQGRRKLVFSLDATQPDGPVALAASYAGIGDIQGRLMQHRGFVSLFNGYVLLTEGESRLLLFPPVQPALLAIEQALARATRTPSGTYIVAESSDGLGRVTLGVEYPAYYVYDLEECLVKGAAWQPHDRAGRDQLVALLADAYHKGHWFARQADVVWQPR